MPNDIVDITNKIILRTDADKGDIISNLKLQKLLYYMQGITLLSSMKNSLKII